jgi:hypothetical protein
MSYSMTFAQLEAALASMAGVDATKRTAFSGRLKNLHKFGVGAGGRPGRGKTSTYSAVDFAKHAMAVELMQSGLPPEKVVETLNATWSVIYDGLQAESFSGELWLIICPAFLSSLSSKPAAPTAMYGSDVSALIAKAGRRAILIDLSLFYHRMAVTAYEAGGWEVEYFACDLFPAGELEQAA